MNDYFQIETNIYEFFISYTVGYTNQLKTDEKQLYFLIKKFQAYLNNEHDTHTLTGFSVIGGLIDFSTEIGSAQIKRRTLNPQAIEEIKFQEVRGIYRFMNEIINELDHTADATQTVYHTAASIESRIQQIYDKRSIEQQQSVLLKNIMESLNEKRNIRDTIRKKGNTLVEEVRIKKSFFRPYDILTQDYLSIEKCLVTTKKFEYK